MVHWSRLRCTVWKKSGTAVDLDFAVLQTMLASNCYQMRCAKVYTFLGNAIHNPMSKLFPLRLEEQYLQQTLIIAAHIKTWA